MKKTFAELGAREIKFVSGGMLVPLDIVAPVGFLAINAMVFLCKYLIEKNMVVTKKHHD